MGDVKRDSKELPGDLQPTADWLRSQRPETSTLELDRIKRRVQSRAMREGDAIASPRRRRMLSVAVGVVALTIGLGGAVAIAGKAPPFWPLKAASSQSSAANAQYKPGKGCGKGEHHVRGGECKAVAGSAGLGGSGAGGGGGSELTGSFPLTGLDVGLLAVAGLAVLAAGLALRRRRAVS
jgi:hypothetical protein